MTASGAARGRPRAFDREAALNAATLLFWERGYEATSIADLTGAMGIRPPSLYAAFGDKRALFTEVVARYAEQYGFARRALDEEPTVRGGIARMLRDAAREYTDPGHPHGCLIITVGGGCAEPAVREAMQAISAANRAELAARIAAAVAAGEEPAEAEPETLARLAATVLQGMSQQAREGASREQLEAVAAAAMRAWPTA
ncbi:TetR/AcrR family transcriptional regulator [Kitasatospora sp. NPDC006697]|uniref:TetR/AcrR family transcriptional regulator n=1 Tax=Kitasatospora sp. NPDC006697 TaxID=3364020 RepID=UPI00368E577B